MSSSTNGWILHKPRGRLAEGERRAIRSETGRAGERVRKAGRDQQTTRGFSYDLPLATMSADPLEEADLFILRSGEPEIGEGDGDLN